MPANLDTAESIEPTERPAQARTWLGLVMGVQLVLSALFASFTYADVRSGGGIVLWGFLSGPVILAALITGVVAVWRRGAVTGSRPRGVPWFAGSVAGLLLAHWAPMLAWTPVAAAYAAIAHGSRAEDHVISALLGLIAWGVCLGSAAVLWRTRSLRSAISEGRPAKRSSEATWWFEAALACGYAAPVGLFATIWVAQGEDGGGLAWIAIPLLVGTGTLLGASFAWCGAAADVEAARLTQRNGHWMRAFQGRLGGLGACMAAPVYLLTLLPMWDGAAGQRLGMQTFVVVCCGVGVWLAASWRSRAVGLSASAG